jgi:hypothetical protein
MPELFITQAIAKNIAAEKVGLGARFSHLPRMLPICPPLGFSQMAATMVLINTQVYAFQIILVNIFCPGITDTGMANFANSSFFKGGK